MTRYKKRPQGFWYIGKRNKNKELGLLIFLGVVVGGGALGSLTTQSRTLLIILLATIICLVFVGAAGFVAWAAYRNQQRLRALSIAHVDSMNGRQFELYVGEVLRSQGFSVEVTKTSGDYGTDIVAHKGREKWAIQTKCYSHPVGNEAVNEVVGSKNYYRCDRTMVVTNNRFTPHAKTAAHVNHTVLVDRDKLAEWIIAFQTGKRI